MKYILKEHFTEKKVYQYLLYLSACIWLFLIIRFITIGGVVVSEVDEVPFFNSSKAFANQFTLKSTGVIEEEASKITESDWYGPGYPLVYGSFRILLGNSDKSFIFTNLIFICIVLIIISKFGIDATDKKWLCLAVLLCPSIVNYSFMFMPVILDLTMASVLVLILIQIGYNEKEQDSRKQVILYLFCVLISSLIKQNFLFFSLGILVFSKNWKWLFVWIVCIAVLFVFVLTYDKYFLAPAYYVNYKETMDDISNLRILEFFYEVKDNFIINLLEFKSKTATPLVFRLPFYMILLPFLVFLLNLKEKNKIVFSLFIISFVTFITYLTFYTTNWIYFIRITIPLVFINSVSVLFLQSRSKKTLMFLILFLMVLSLPLSVMRAIKNQDIKKNNYDYVNYQMPDFTHIASFIEENKLNTFLIDEDFYKLYGFEQFLMALPIETGNNIIRYTVNYRLKNKFELLHKLKVDYVLTPGPQDIPNTTIVNKTDYYYLYKFTD